MASGYKEIHRALFLVSLRKNVRLHKMREQLIECTKVYRREKRDDDDEHGEPDCLAAGRPAHVSKLRLGVFDVLDE